MAAKQAGTGRDGGGRFVAGTSGNPAGRRPRHRDFSTRIDGLTNALTGIGVAGKDKRLGATFYADTITPEVALEWWRGHDLAARIIETEPNEMLREGWCLRVAEEEEEPEEPRTPGAKKNPFADTAAGEMTAEGDEEPEAAPPRGFEGRKPRKRYDEEKSADLSDEVTAILEDLQFESTLREALCYENAFGGGAVLIGANDGQELDQPLNLERITSIDWFTALESRELQPEEYYANPQAAKFGKPAIYLLNASTPGAAYKGDYGKQAGVRVHESRLLILPGIVTSRRRATYAVNGWGDSKLSRVVRVLSDYDMSWHATSILLHDFAQAIYKLKDLANLVGQDTHEADEVIKTRLAAVELSRSVARAVIIDAEEEFERKTTTVTGLPDLLKEFSARLAAAADMPLTLLMGQSPGGLNATGESDVRFFYDRIRALQSKKLRPLLERVVKIVMATLGGEPEQWSIEFKPLWQVSDKERAEARNIQAKTDETYVNLQVVSPEEIAHARFGGDEYSFETTIDWDARAAGTPLVDPPAKTEQQLEAEEAERQMMEASLRSASAEADGKASGGGFPPKKGAPPEDDERADSIELRGNQWALIRDGVEVSRHATYLEAMGLA